MVATRMCAIRSIFLEFGSIERGDPALYEHETGTAKEKVSRVERLQRTRWRERVVEDEMSTYIFIARPKEFFLRIEGEGGHWCRGCIWCGTRQRNPRCLKHYKFSVSKMDVK